ncbi:MAG TPA: ABC transporter ATP-binding protein [Methanocorpusculum sp.]|nr:ABC transporter ATP-binding protein [Methanocorpusculum sp.]
MSDELLRIEDLTVHLTTKDGFVHAVDSASFSIKEREIFAMIGESGSGKSILGSAVLRLLPDNAVCSGKIILNGMDIMSASKSDMQKIRGKTIASIAQSPYLAMNPSLHVGRQIEEPMIEHLSITKQMAKLKTRSILKYFDIIPEEKRAKEYPHQFSGGMLQRSLVAMGTAAEPKLIIADEPTTGVDVIQKRNIAELFSKVRDDGCAFFLITHDVNFARAIADYVAVNYCGQILEISEKEEFFKEPLHPYSKALINSMPENVMKPIPGNTPSMINPPFGCRFYSRCPYAEERCRDSVPELYDCENGSVSRCFIYA